MIFEKEFIPRTGCCKIDFRPVIKILPVQFSDRMKFAAAVEQAGDLLHRKLIMLIIYTYDSQGFHRHRQ
jgi:hypothetical protein